MLLLNLLSFSANTFADSCLMLIQQIVKSASTVLKQKDDLFFSLILVEL